MYYLIMTESYFRFVFYYWMQIVSGIWSYHLQLVVSCLQWYHIGRIFGGYNHCSEPLVLSFNLPILLERISIIVFQHFIKYRVTTQIYAWSLLQSGFSEVFSRNEWMKIWDHILINQPSWMLMAVVAYTLVNRGPLLECYELEEFKQFYR